MPEWLIGLVLKTRSQKWLVGSNPILPEVKKRGGGRVVKCGRL